MQIYDLAGGAPTPLRAFALRKIAVSVTLNDQVWKRELLGESFDAAVTAPLPWPVDYVVMAEGAAPRLAHRLQEAMERNNGLDRLTLQSEAVTAMVAVDQAEARKLFERIEPPQPIPLSCRDSFIPHIAIYYQAAAKIPGGLSFYESVVASMRAPEAVQPVANMLLEHKLPEAELEAMAMFYSRQLDAIPPDNRAFFNNLKHTSETLETFVGKLQGRPVASVLQRSIRTYLVTNLKAPACKEATDPAFIYSRWASEAVEKFNGRIAPGSPVAPLDKSETVPGRIDDGLPSDPALSSADNDKLSQQWFALIFGKQRTGLSDAQKNTPEWKSHLTDFGNAIENLERLPKETSADLIWRKCQWIAQAAMVAPAGPDRIRFMRRYVDLLNVSDLQPDEVSAWYGQIQNFLGLSKAISNSGPEANRALQENGNALIHLVAALDVLR